LNSGCRDAEVQNTEYADFSWEKNTLHVQAKPWRNFRLKGKKKNRIAKDRFIPLPAVDDVLLFLGLRFEHGANSVADLFGATNTATPIGD